MQLNPWCEIAVPHEDVRQGNFQQSEFAADLSHVHDRKAVPEYQNPSLFFERTYVTEGMELLLISVMKRLIGKGGDPVIQLQTAFGGGKTHTMLAVYHLATATVPSSQLPGIPAVLDKAGVTELPRARVAVLDGNKSAPDQPIRRGSVTINTLWGDLAWQLGGEEGYQRVAQADQSGTSPGKAVLEELIRAYAPCVILVDELVAYIRQFEDGKTHAGGTFDSNLSFVQALTEALKTVPNAVMLASLPESVREAGSDKGMKALEALSHYFARVQALWKPVATEEAFEIVRRRLFNRVDDRSSLEKVCRAYADFYANNGDAFPGETQQAHYYDRLLQAYPIHPEVFDRLYEDWSSLDNFQRTRGVLKLMAKVIHRLWKDNNQDPLIMPGSMPFYDPDMRTEALNYLPPGWDPVVERDVDGDRAETTEIETREPLFGRIQACRRIGRTVLLGSAPNTAVQHARGVELERILLGAALPGQPIGSFKDALRRLENGLHYLNSGNGRYWFDTKPNLRREMEERKRRFSEKDDVFPVIRDRLRESLPIGTFRGVHVFSHSQDIPDDWDLRLVVLAPDVAYTKVGVATAKDRAQEILRKRGEQPRLKQNRLIFLVADFDAVSRLKEQVRSFLSWTTIVEDIREMRLNLDQFQARQASKSLEDAREVLRRMVREAYKWLLVPSQHIGRNGLLDTEITWEPVPVNSSAPNAVQEIERVLKDQELLITEWSPIHLARELKNWFWKDDKTETSAMEFWQKSCQYLYLPRLRDSLSFHATLNAGALSEDFFGFAYGVEGEKYLGFALGKGGSPLLDDSLLLIEPKRAQAYARELRVPEPDPGPGPGPGPGPDPDPGPGPGPDPDPVPPPRASKRRFFATADIPAVNSKMAFAAMVDEVIQQFTAKPGVRVRISLDVEAESEAGFDESVQRTVKENCNTLKFRSADFEE